MGTFKTKIKIATPGDKGLLHAIELEVYVDAGATFSQIPQEVAKQLGLEAKREEHLRLADGRSIVRKIAGAQIWVQGKVTFVDVLLGENTDEPLLGATALEQTGFYVDPRGEKLIAREAILLL